MNVKTELGSTVDVLTRLEQIAAASQADLEEAVANIRGTPALVLPEGVRVTTLEQILPRPLRRRGVFSTNLLASFLGYCVEYADTDTEVFVDAHQMSAKAIFDSGDEDSPLWRDHTGTLSLKATAEFNALAQSNNIPMAQGVFIDWVEDNEDSLTFFDQEGQPIKTPMVLRTLRELTVHTMGMSTTKVENLSSSATAMETVEFSSEHQFPAGFMFTTVPYLNLESRDIPAVIKARKASDTQVSLSYRIRGKETLFEDIAHEFADLLSNADELDASRVYIGSYT